MSGRDERNQAQADAKHKQELFLEVVRGLLVWKVCVVFHGFGAAVGFGVALMVGFGVTLDFGVGDGVGLTADELEATDADKLLGSPIYRARSSSTELPPSSNVRTTTSIGPGAVGILVEKFPVASAFSIRN